MRQVIFTFIFTSIILTFFSSCKKSNSDDANPVETGKFAVSSDSMAFAAAGGTSPITVTMNGSNWVATSNQSWCTLSPASSTATASSMSVTTTLNTSYYERKARLLLVKDKKDTVYVNVSQAAQKSIYPDYSNRIASDASGMASEAKMLAAKIFAGWNLGNSLDVPGGETFWGNPKTTQALINSVKAAGINAVRIPCAWNGYIEDVTTCKLKASWLARVKEVVDYCYQNDMYVILNIHWDGGWLDDNPTYAMQPSVMAKEKAIWEQIAVYFRGYDEHLIFAGTDEVHSSTTATTENYTVQMSYNQTFVNAVRSTGGKNSYRNLIIQAYNTNIDQAVSNLVVSNDSVVNRLMVEVHYYDPSDFCLLTDNASWGTPKYYWGTDYSQYGAISSGGQEDHVCSQFQKMKSKFVDKGYPVILGEYGAVRRTSLTGSTLEHHLASRAYYLQYVTRQAKNYGIVPFIWDSGSTANNGMALFNRGDGSIFDSQSLNAFISGATNGSYPL